MQIGSMGGVRVGDPRQMRQVYSLVTLGFISYGMVTKGYEIGVRSYSILFA